MNGGVPFDGSLGVGRAQWRFDEAFQGNGCSLSLGRDQRPVRVRAARIARAMTIRKTARL